MKKIFLVAWLRDLKNDKDKVIKKIQALTMICDFPFLDTSIIFQKCFKNSVLNLVVVQIKVQKSSNHFHNAYLILKMSKKHFLRKFQSSSLCTITFRFLTKYSNSSSVRFPS